MVKCDMSLQKPAMDQAYIQQIPFGVHLNRYILEFNS